MNNNLITKGNTTFLGKNIPVIEGGFGERNKCVLDITVANIHETETKLIRRIVLRHSDKFEENVDFIDLKIGVPNWYGDLLKEAGYNNNMIAQAKNIYLFSERGYRKLIKCMNTDLAWEIFDKMEDEYFHLREVVQTISPKVQMLLDICLAEGDVATSMAINRFNNEYLLPLENKAEYVDKVLSPKGLLTSTDIAKDFGISAVKFNKMLKEAKIIYKENDCYVPYSKYQFLVTDGMIDFKVILYGEGKTKQTMRWTEKGRKWLVDNKELWYVG